MAYAEANKTTHPAVNVTTTRVLLRAGNSKRYVLFIVNEGAGKVYIGDADVTAANGIPVPSGSIYPDYDSKDAWYAITSSGTADVRLMEIESG